MEFQISQEVEDTLAEDVSCRLRQITNVRRKFIKNGGSHGICPMMTITLSYVIFNSYRLLARAGEIMLSIIVEFLWLLSIREYSQHNFVN